MSFWAKNTKQFFELRDISSLVVLRISLGVVMFWEIVVYFNQDWIQTYFTTPRFNFSFKFFEWIKPLEGQGMTILFYVLGILSVLIILGLFYKAAIFFFFLLFSYVFLIEQAIYLNHFYLISLTSFLLIFMPAHRAFSVDAWLFPKIKKEQIHAWTILLLRFQFGIVYFFGGIAKMNYDWLVHAEPMRHWLSDKPDFPLLGNYFSAAAPAYFMSWSGMFLDLLAPFLLLKTGSRPFMFAVLLLFHIMNDRLFRIGIFPWFMLFATTIFFPPDWPKKFLQTLTGSKHTYYILAASFLFAVFCQYFRGVIAVIPFIVSGCSSAILIWLLIDFTKNRKVESRLMAAVVIPKYSVGIIFCIAIWTGFQIIIPLRHFAIPGNVHWTDEGYFFSWQMMLKHKEGVVRFYAFDPVGKNRIALNPPLTSVQHYYMPGSPQMILQTAQFLKNHLHESEHMKEIDLLPVENYEIRVTANISLNFRSPLPLIDSTVNLAEQSYSVLSHNSWILLHDSIYRLNPLPVTKQKNNY